MNRPPLRDPDHLSEVVCDHCGLAHSFHLSLKLDAQEGSALQFCCHGCRMAWQVIHQWGLESFYRKKDTKLSPASGNLSPLSQLGLESEAFRQRFIHTEQGLSQITFLIKGIHCAACVWLNENLLKKLPGVDEVRIHYTSHLAQIRWDESQTPIQTLIEKIRSIGYDAIPYDPLSPQSEVERTDRQANTRLITAVFCSMNIMWIAVAQYAGYFTGMEQRFLDLFNLVGFVLASPVLFYSGMPFLRGALAGLRNRVLGMDFQVAASTLLVYGYSVTQSLQHSHKTYFEAVAMFITFISLGKYLELKATRKIIEAGRWFQSLLPLSATRLVDGKPETVSVDAVQAGWLLEALPGDVIVTDGHVVEGSSSVNEAHITGESVPVLKRVGSQVNGGSINCEGRLLYRASCATARSTLASIVNMVQEAINQKPPTRQLADKLSKYFVSVLTLLAGAVFLGGMWFGLPLEEAISRGIAVLIIACPCALSLATPIAVLAGLSVAAEHKILFRHGNQFETLVKIRHVLLDKTGTLTVGKPEVLQAQILKSDAVPAIIQLCSMSRHPFSQAIHSHLTEHHPSQALPPLQEFVNLPGQGLQAFWKGERLLGGSRKFVFNSDVRLSDDIQMQVEAWTKQGDSLFVVAVGEEVVALFAMRDSLRQESAAAVNALKQSGLSVMLLTGDHEQAAHQVAKQCGISEGWVFAERKPEGKKSMIEDLQAKGDAVLMVGDGINDAPALAQADIGIAMGSSTQTAMEVSGIVLLDNNLNSLVNAIGLSRQTFQLIRQNLIISTVYNLIAIPLAMVGWVIPLVAAASMSLSSLIVVFNSLKVRRWARSAFEAKQERESS